MFSLIALPNQNYVDPGERRKQVPFSMAVEKMELMEACFPTLAHGNSNNERRQKKQKKTSGKKWKRKKVKRARKKEVPKA